MHFITNTLSRLPRIYFILALVLFGFTLSAQKTVTIHTTPGQPIKLGMDVERLWWWFGSEANKEKMVDMMLETNPTFVRVSILPSYEREQGNKKLEVYDRVLDLMNMIKSKKPDIKFFATPQPLREAYSLEEIDQIWGSAGIPWAPYPGWIMGYPEVGGNGSLNQNAVAQYFADYLNIMADNNIDITYMDFVNEHRIVTPEVYNYVVNSSNNIQSRLNPGVKFPIIIGPSSWSFDSGTDWLNEIPYNSTTASSFSIASAHNTGPKTTDYALNFTPVDDFTKAAHKHRKELWNTELHNWIGKISEVSTEIKSSVYLWDSFRSGFSGVITWLAFGNKNGSTHAMVRTNGVSTFRTTKLEIFKKLGEMNEGYYIYGDKLSSAGMTTTASFIKGNKMQIWALNADSLDAVGSVSFYMDGREITSNKITKTIWRLTGGTAGLVSEIEKLSPKGFSQYIHGGTLYCFEFNVGELQYPPRLENIGNAMWLRNIGSPIQVGPTNSTGARTIWEFTPTEGAWFSIKSAFDSKYLTVSGGNPTVSSSVLSNGTSEWKKIILPSGRFHLLNKGTGKYLATVSGTSQELSLVNTTTDNDLTKWTEVSTDPDPTGTITSLEGADQLKEFSVYPNPSTSGRYYLNSSVDQVVKVLDMAGREIQTVFLERGEQEVDLSAYSKGVYLIKSESGFTTQVIR